MDHYCPICKSLLQTNGPQYSIDQLFELWKPIIFTSQTIEEHRAQSQNTRMYSCPNCELDIFLPIIIGTPQFYQELQGNEKFEYYEETKWEFSESLKDIQNLKSLIEIGCGTGNYLAFIKKICPNSLGIEYNENAIQHGKNERLNIIHIDEVQKLKRGSFDVSVSFHVLEHVDHPVDFVQNLASWVKTNGKICISAPNQEGPVKYIIPCHSNMPPHHSTRWRKKTFEVLAHRLNLKIERVAYEPLLLSNHSYYSSYWVNLVISRDTKISQAIRYILKISLTIFFNLLIIFRLKYFNFLKGQSIYVVMIKKGE